MENQGLASSVTPASKNQAITPAKKVVGDVLTLGLLPRDAGLEGFIIIPIIIFVVWPLLIGLVVGFAKQDAKKGVRASLYTILAFFVVTFITSLYGNWQTKQGQAQAEIDSKAQREAEALRDSKLQAHLQND